MVSQPLEYAADRRGLRAMAMLEQLALNALKSSAGFFLAVRSVCVAGTIVADLLCRLRLLCPDGTPGQSRTKTLRYRLLHTTARIMRGQRKRTIRIPETWPWIRQLAACFLAAFALSPPT